MQASEEPKSQGTGQSVLRFQNMGLKHEGMNLTEPLGMWKIILLHHQQKAFPTCLTDGGTFLPTPVFHVGTLKRDICCWQKGQSAQADARNLSPS